MLNGKLDRVVPPEMARRLYNSIATPDEDKRLVMMDSDHFPFPRGQVGREMNAWLDRYLGPVPR